MTKEEFEQENTRKLEQAIIDWMDQIKEVLSIIDGVKKDKVFLPSLPKHPRLLSHRLHNQKVTFSGLSEATQTKKISTWERRRLNAQKIQFRLLNLKAWSVRYTVDLEFILRTLFAYYRKTRRTDPSKRFSTLGIPINALTGEASRITLEEAIAKAFPNGENIDDKNNAQRLRMVDTLRPIKLHSGTIEGSIDEYNRITELRRREYDTAKQKFQRRPWKGNPWR